MAVKKDAAFYRKQREQDKAAAAKGDPKAKKELAQIEAKRVKARGKYTPSKHAADIALRRGPDTRGSGDAKRALDLGSIGKAIKGGVEAVGKRAAQNQAAMDSIGGKIRSGLSVQKPTGKNNRQ